MAPLSAQSNYYLPQVIDGLLPSSGGSLRTSVLLSNAGATSATVTINLTRDDGTPLQVNFPDLGPGNRFSLTLKPGSTRILQTDGSGDGSAGAATISSTVPVGVSTIISGLDPSGALLSESGAGSSDTAAAYTIPVDSTGGLNTSVALYNPGTTAATLTFTLFDVNGAKLETAMSSLAPGAHLAKFVAGDLFADINNFRGTLVVASTKPVAAAVVRQNSGTQSYTLLPAIPSTSMRLRFFLPQLADGPSPSATLQTTVLVSNLSKNPATVTLTLSQDNGTPWVVNIPGVDANNTVKLPPGGSALLQTSGQGTYTTGAAALISDQPIAVAAVVTASDAQGKFLSETGLTESPAQSSFLLPIDTTNNINTGAAFFNPTLDPVTLTLNLLDPDGNQVASTQVSPLAPGAHLSGYVSDFFPGMTGFRGTLSVTASGVVGAAVAVASLRQNTTALALATTPVTVAAVTGAGLNLTTAQDAAHQTMSAIPPAGGALSLTDAKGNKFTLTIPAGALINTETIMMTAVTSVGGLPAGGTFAAGVQLAPDGLILLRPALLTIEPAIAIPAGMAIPLGWHSTGQGVYINLVPPHSDKLTLALTHFSGAAAVTGSDAVTSQLLNIANILDLDSSLAGYWTNKARNDEKQGLDSSGDYQRALDVLDRGFSDIELLMRLALESQDDDVLRCAMMTALGYERQREILVQGSGASDAIGTAINGFIQTASSLVQQHAQDRCNNLHDPLAGLELLGQFRQATILGMAGAAPAAPDLSKCSPNPVLDFKSEMSEDGALSISMPPLMSDVKFDGKVTAKVFLAGKLSQDSLQPGGDGFTSFLLSGSGKLDYTSFSYAGKGTGQGADGPTTLKMEAVPGSATGSTLKIIEKQGNAMSEIKYRFTPKFSPMVLRFNGQTLSQFCPVYDKTPAAVTLIVDPGSPQASILSTITGPKSAPVMIPSVSSDWRGVWDVFHGSQYQGTDEGIITIWQVPGGSSFAHKEFSQSKMFSGDFYKGTATEKTTLDLNNPQ